MEAILRRMEERLRCHDADGAIDLAREYLEAGGAASDAFHYLLGNAWRKKGDWQHAIDNYLEAVALNPESPARQALEIAGDILSFYNKDMYNQ